jgi:hypothetical protein
MVNQNDYSEIAKDIDNDDISLNVADYFGKAADAIDAAFGPRHAKEHPEMIAAFVQAYAVDRQTEVLLCGFEALVRETRDLRTRPSVPSVLSEGGAA